MSRAIVVVLIIVLLGRCSSLALRRMEIAR